MKRLILILALAVPAAAQTPTALTVTVTGQVGNFVQWLQNLPGCGKGTTNPFIPGQSKCGPVAGGVGTVGPQGPQGVPGPAGAVGPQGPAGAVGTGGAVMSTLVVGNPSAATLAALPPGANGIAFDGSPVPRKPALGVYYFAADSVKGCIVYSQNGSAEKCLP